MWQDNRVIVRALTSILACEQVHGSLRWAHSVENLGRQFSERSFGTSGEVCTLSPSASASTQPAQISRLQLRAPLSPRTGINFCPGWMMVPQTSQHTASLRPRSGGSGILAPSPASRTGFPRTFLFIRSVASESCSGSVSADAELPMLPSDRDVLYSSR